MLSLNNRSIAAKIGVLIAAFAVLACGLIGIATVGFRWNDAQVEDALNNQAKSLFLVSQAHEQATRMHQQVFAILAEPDPAQWSGLQQNVVTAAGRLAETLTRIKPTLDDGDLAIYGALTAAAEDYRSAERRGYDLLQSAQRPEGGKMLMAAVSDRFTKLDSDLATFVDKQTHDMDVAGAAIHALSQKTVILMVVTGLGGLCLTVFIALLVTRVSISRPILAMTGAMGRLAAGDTTITVPGTARKDEIGAMAAAVQAFKEAALAQLRLEQEADQTRRLIETERARNEAERERSTAEQATVVAGIAAGLEHLAQGDLTFRLQAAFAAQYETLRADFNGAMVRVEEAITAVASNATVTRAGATEIAAASDDLSRRTEQQAASLEETAAALDEITATVRKTSDGAAHAHAVVSAAKADAERSGQVVSKAVEAMTAIEASARKVGQIIGVIDEIAFQTNLLALNAGVEAARAGEAGRGFAVVASEVRALAQRSAEAAKEIKSLISMSGTQVGEGVTLVSETGRSLERIIVHVADIATVVAGIAASAQEQAGGLGQVNVAINQMDQVTQQNAAMVEQSTAASHGLLRETEALAQLIGRFRLGAAGSNAPVRSAQRRGTVPALRSIGRGGAAPKTEPEAEAGWSEF